MIKYLHPIKTRIHSWKYWHRLKKALLITIGIIIIIVIIAIALISPITKYLIEKYDEKYTGRQITLKWAYVNPFTGFVSLNHLKIYELKSDSVFFSANRVTANFSIFKLLSSNYEITELIISQPYGIIIQNVDDLNFRDLITKFTPKKKLIPSGPIHFSILKIIIVDGLVYYRERQIPINYFVKKVNMESPGFRWDNDTITANYSFLSGIKGGDMKGVFKMNSKTQDFFLNVIARKYDLEILEQYLRDLTNYGAYTANIDADLNVKGNFKEATNVTFQGKFAMNDFHIGKTPTDDYASFKKLNLAIFELSPKNNKYLFDTVEITKPYFKFEQYDISNNLQYMFNEGKVIAEENGSVNAKFNLVIEIGNYIKILSKNFFRSNFRINRLAVIDGDLKYNDYSKSEKFSMDCDPINITADSIDRQHKRVHLYSKSGIKPFGNAILSLSINPNDSTDFDIQYDLQKLSICQFNPYIINYTSYPLDRGTISINGTWNVNHGNISSKNHVLIIDPRVAKRIKNEDNNWIPVPLIMALARENGNVIDYEIPISGNLKNPKFHLRDVVMDVIRNIFIKPPTIPYRMDVKSTETEIEKSLTLKWELRRNSLMPKQQRFMKRMAAFLSKNEDAYINVYPQCYDVKEKEYILFFEAKKKYFLATHNKANEDLNKNELETVERMSIKDSSFVKYVNKHIDNSLVFTIQEKCTLFVNKKVLELKFNQLQKERENTFISFFKDEHVEKQINIHANQNVIPYNGFSFYKIEYKGEIPEALTRAYRKLIGLNDNAPRKKYIKDRKKVKTTF